MVDASGVLVAMWMTPDVVSVRAEATGPEMARVMSSHRVRRVPVVDDGGRVLGMVSKTDLLRATPRHLNPFSVVAGDAAQMDFVARDVMASPAVCVHANDLIGTAAEVLEARKLGAAPVLASPDRHELVGVLSQTDLARAFRQIFSPDEDRLRRSTWELPDVESFDSPDQAERLGAAVRAAGGSLKGFWAFAHRDALWLVVLTRGLDDPDALHSALPVGRRLLHASPAW